MKATGIVVINPPWVLGRQLADSLRVVADSLHGQILVQGSDRSQARKA
jgi:23S rRNA A2030 N6-methylase RlmJ